MLSLGADAPQGKLLAAGDSAGGAPHDIRRQKSSDAAETLFLPANLRVHHEHAHTQSSCIQLLYHSFFLVCFPMYVEETRVYCTENHLLNSPKLNIRGSRGRGRCAGPNCHFLDRDKNTSVLTHVRQGTLLLFRLQSVSMRRWRSVTSINTTQREDGRLPA